MAGTITLYEPDGGEREPIKADLGAGYRAILDEVSENVDGEPEQLVSRTVEALIHQSIQEMQVGDNQIHSAYAELIYQLEDTGEIDVQSVVENAIHTLHQQT